MQIDKFYKNNGYKVPNDFISRYKIIKKRNTITTMTIYYADGLKKRENYSTDLEENIISTMKEQAIVFSNSELYDLLENYYNSALKDDFYNNIYLLRLFRQMMIGNQHVWLEKLKYYLSNQALFDSYREGIEYIKENTYRSSKNPKKVLTRKKYGNVPVVKINNLEKFSISELENIEKECMPYTKKPLHSSLK